MSRGVAILVLALSAISVGIGKAKASAADAEGGQGADRPLPNEAFVRLEVHYSILTDLSDRSDLTPAFGYAVKGGYRWGTFGAFVEFEQDFWVATEFDARVVQGAYNIGVGVDFTYFEGRVHSSIAFGPSILAFDTLLDSRGSLGLFFDLRPLGLQWDVHRRVRLGLDPLSFALVAPALDGIPITQVQYRTSFYVEFPL